MNPQEIVVDGDLSVRDGHAIGHRVKIHLLASQHRINDVSVHVEPNDNQPKKRPERLEKKGADS